MSRVLLGQSYYLRFDPKLREARQPYPPLGTLYACACLRASGHDVGLFDAMLATSEADWDAALAKMRPQVAVLYEDNFNYLSKMCLLRMRQAAFTMIDRARARGCLVIVAGSDPSDHPELYLSAGATFVIVGEGEQTLEALVNTLDGRSTRATSEIPGLVYRSAAPTDALLRTGTRPDLDRLDTLPAPAWDLVDLQAYRAIWRGAHGRFSLNLVSSRGCPYHCNWCAKPIWGQRYHVHTPERVASDLAFLSDTCGADHVWFADDILGLQPGWLSAFADILEARGLRVPFKCQTRADLVIRDGQAPALRRAGAEVAWIGAESGSQRVLDAMEKGITVAHIEAATHSLRSEGIGVGFFIQFGYPGETWEDIMATFELVRRCAPDDIGVSVAYPLPGTPFFERVRRDMRAADRWVDSNDLAMLYGGPHSTAFYRELHTLLHREFRARRSWRWATAGVPLPGGPSVARGRHVARSLWNAALVPLARVRLARVARRDLAHGTGARRLGQGPQTPERDAEGRS